MSGINQIQMSFSPSEDRILMRMNTTDSTSFQFWLTRRYVKLLWPVLLSMLVKDEKITAQQSDQAKQEVLSFQHQEAAQKMNYSREYQADTQQQPLGSEPILLGRIGANEREDGTQVLSMHPETGQGVELALNQTLLHSVCKLLQDTVEKTDWDINLAQSLSTSNPAHDIAPRAIN